MRCAQVAPYLAAASDELERATARSVREHIDECSACRAEALRYGRIHDSIMAIGAAEPVPPTGLVDAILERTAPAHRRSMIPFVPLPTPELARAISENREAIANTAGVALVAAGAAWALWRGFKAVRRPAPNRA